MKRRRFTVLDRNGTINVERQYLSDPDQVEVKAMSGRPGRSTPIVSRLTNSTAETDRGTSIHDH